MESKREFFEARATNREALREAATSGMFRSLYGSQPTFIRVPGPDTLVSSKPPSSANYDLDNKETTQKSANEKIEENTTTRDGDCCNEDICDADGDYEEYDSDEYAREVYGMSEDEHEEDTEIADELDEMFDEKEVNIAKPRFALEPAAQTNGGAKTGYSKFSINDMMNHESPEAQVVETQLLASPPPSEISATEPMEFEKTKAVPALEDILNPEAASPLSGLKRKRTQFEEEPISQATIDDGPEVVDEVVEPADYPELAIVEQSFETQKVPVEEKAKIEGRPIKRARTSRGYFGLATATMIGAVMGGVGVFAALVATAQ